MADLIETGPACLLQFFLPRGTLRQLGDLAEVPGLHSAYKVGAREIRPGRRMGLLRFSGISPEREIMRMVVPEERAEQAFGALASRFGLDQGLAGSGCIMPARRHLAHPDDPPSTVELPAPAGDQHSFIQNLTAVTCICQRGKAEAIAGAAMEAGCPPPAVSFGTGRGIRDRLGLLRIAVNPEKEIIETVVGQFDAPGVFDAMVDAGRLDDPGMGFIYTRPVSKGIFRADTVRARGGPGASLEQIVRAIDEMKGSQDWRAAGSFQSAVGSPRRGLLSDQVNIVVVARQGLGDACVARAMAAGASGATITTGTWIGSHVGQHSSGRWVTREAEIVDLNVDAAESERIVDAIREVPEIGQPAAAYIITIPVPLALTYLGG